jgi:ribosomal protein S18 acetylase RimI-like enzyme
MTGKAAIRGSTRRAEPPLAVIREVDLRDVPRLEALYAALPHPPASLDDKARSTEEWLKDVLRRGFNFVAEETGKLVAHLVMIRAGDSAEMSIFVHPDHRQRGIGGALLRIALDQARDMDLRHVWLAVASGDSSLQETLSGFGFVVSRRTGAATEMALAL